MYIIQNPVRLPNNEAIRDPMIIRYDNRYYMVGTTKDFWDGPNPGVKLWTSDDLLNWKFVKLIIDSSKIGDDKPYKDRFWAPELFYHNKKFYCTFNAHNASKTTTAEGQRSWVAVSDSIDGQYTIVEEPIYQGGFSNDAHLFEDEDGKVYIFLTIYGSIIRLNFDTETCKAYGNEQTVIKPGEKGEWDNAGIEGSFVVKRNGIYYHWYSSWTRTYEMGVATTDDLSKPFVKSKNNPIISGYLTDSKMKFCGHNSCFKLIDGRDAVAFHTNGDDFEESLCINIVEYPLEKTYAPQEKIEIKNN